LEAASKFVILADDADMTMRAFVLNALKDKGLDVRPDDLADLRKERQ
jgi:ribosomal protein L7Ae-like RNA K-turn-binding protein